MAPKAPTRHAAQVGTDTATIYAIAPEALYNLINEEEWHEWADSMWGEVSKSSDATWDAMTRLIREHGGAVFETGADGGHDVKVPGARREMGFLPPYGTPAYGKVAVRSLMAQRLVLRHQAQVVVARMKAAGWWQINPDIGKGGIHSDAVPVEDRRYNGDGPADMADDFIDKLDLVYRQVWGRPVYPEELRAVFNFVTGPVNDRTRWPLNEWVDVVSEHTGLSPKAIASLPEQERDELRQAWRDYRNSRFQIGVPYSSDNPPPEPSQEALDDFRETARLIVRHTLTDNLAMYDIDPETGGTSQITVGIGQPYEMTMRAEKGEPLPSRVAGHREVQEYKGLRAYWDFNSPRERVYGVSIDTPGDVGQIVFDKRSFAWVVFAYPDWPESDTRKVKLTAFTSADDREGVKRALMALHDYWNRQDRFASRTAGSEAHDKSVALMKFLSGVAKSLGPDVGRHTYVVGGAVRDFVLDRPIKDVDVVIDSVALGGKKDSEWFAKQVVRRIPAQVNLVTNQYGVALLNITGPWVLDGLDMQGEDIEIANARSESYGGEEGKGYKPHMVAPSTIEEDVVRRELTYNTLMLRLLDLANGPDKKDIVDLTGCGLRDLEQGVMQCPRDPNVVFTDDPSRMIRVIKFALRYGHKLTPDTRAAIVRNAGKLKNVPSSHLAQMLTQIVLKEPTWKKALEMMADLGLLAPVREMLLEDQGFRVTMENHVKNQKMDMLFGLVDVGLPLGAALNFLSGPEQTRLREIALAMDRDEAWEFLGMVKNPGNAYKDKNFAPALAQRYGVKGKAVGQFMPLIMQAGRGLLLADPPLAHDPNRLKGLIEDRVEQAMQRTRLASSVGPGDFVKLTRPRGFGEIGAFKVLSIDGDTASLARATVWEDKEVKRVPVLDLKPVNPTYSDLLGHTYYQAAQALLARVEDGGDLKSAIRRTVTLRGAPREVLEVIEQMVHDGLRGRKVASKETPMNNAMQTRVAQRHLARLLAAANLDGPTTGDGSRVGLFVPLPRGLGEEYPDLGDNDDSPPHVTILYVGEVPKEKEALFLEVLTETLRDEPGPIRAWTNGVDSFVHPHAERTVYYTPIRFSRDMGEIRDRLWVALEDAGFDIQHKFPLAFFPHTTLGYADGLYHEHGYQGPVPDGAWEFDTIQVWGLPKLYDIPFRSYGVSVKEMSDLRQQGEVEAWLRKEWGSVLPQE